jgi:L-amino acid N-acyltransferase YncA
MTTGRAEPLSPASLLRALGDSRAGAARGNPWLSSGIMAGMPSPPVEFRSIQDADLQRLFEMYATVVEDGGALPANGASMDVFLDGWIHNRSVSVAWSDDQIVGSYFLRSNFPAFPAHIAQGGYTVSRQARRHGIGGLMVQDSLQLATRLGITAMMFNLVLERNPSRSLYESLGFKVIGRIPEAKADEDGMIYWRSLDDIRAATPPRVNRR